MIPFLKPDKLYNQDVTAVKLDDLKSLGVEGLLIDLDNTIMAPKSARLDPTVKLWLDLMKMHFKIVVLTNNKKLMYLDAVRRVMEDIPVIGPADKPWSKGANEALEIMKLPHEKVCVIGDRPLTDVWLARNHNFKSVLVRAYTADTEPRWKWFLRKIEWSFIKR